MPFRSQNQWRACFAMRSQARKEGKKFTWDCSKMARETKIPFSQLPKSVTRRTRTITKKSKKKKKKTTKRKMSRKRR